MALFLGTLIASRLVPAGTLLIKRGLIAGSTQLAVIYATGSLWLATWYALFRGINLTHALITAAATGILPFVPWDTAKLLSAILLSRLTVVAYYSLAKRIFKPTA